jgi:hypothetical protein
VRSPSRTALKCRPHVRIFAGVESPSVGNFNTISTRARVHHTVRISSYCVIGAGCLVVPADDEVLDEYTVVLWAVRGTTHLEWAWTGAGGGFATETRRVPPGDTAQVQSAEERRSAGLIVRTVATVTVRWIEPVRCGDNMMLVEGVVPSALLMTTTRQSPFLSHTPTLYPTFYY